MTETREELEAKLQAASDSMSRRLTAMEDEVSLPAVARLSNVASSGALKKAAVAVGIGLAVGLLFGGGGDSGSKKRFKRAHTTLDEWREDLADSIAEFLRDGDSPDAAARRAARSQPPLVLDNESGGGARKGLLTLAFAYLVRTGLNLTSRELLKRMIDRNDEPQAS